MKRNNRYKKTNLKSKIIITSIIVILLIIISIFLVLKYIFDGLTINNITSKIQELGISEEIENEYKDSPITNIALFGLDGRNQNVDEGRSDSLMIFSINKSNGKVKLISILRDSYVSIDGYPNQKINHAYSYGGPTLAIKTLNQNFKLNIKDYITVNFSQFISIVDAIGGIDINITEQEKNQINNEVPSLKLSQYGTVHLNGEQALAYTRIRKIDSDNVRADRQKNVIQAIIYTINKTNKANYIPIMRTILSSIETSLQYINILEYAIILSSKNIIIEETTIPGKQENATGGIYKGAWVWRYDLNLASKRLHKFIYE